MAFEQLMAEATAKREKKEEKKKEKSSHRSVFSHKDEKEGRSSPATG